MAWHDDRPPVTVDGRPPDAPPVRQPARRAPVLVLLLLPLVALAVLAVRDHQAAARRREARTAAGLHWTVLAARADPVTRASPGSPTQQGVANLTLRNDSTVEVSLLDAVLDGAGPMSPGPGRVPPHSTAVLPVAWQVRCAEVGNAPGPRLLQLRVRLESRTSYPVEVRLPGAVTDRAFHAAVVAACDVLVAP